ncbi:MAG: hypothetical protein JSR45_13630 [Proteobacteria bacterium]|nr:hypothetical protein [Pseudomonadota bacterium]
MKRWPVRLLGYAILAVGLWLAASLWHVHVRPPNPHLHGHGPADWEEQVDEALVDRAILGVVIQAAGALIVLWASLGEAKPPSATRSAFGALVATVWGLVRMPVQLIGGIACCAPLILSLLIAAHRRSWTHDDWDMAVHAAFL